MAINTSNINVLQSGLATINNNEDSQVYYMIYEINDETKVFAVTTNFETTIQLGKKILEAGENIAEYMAITDKDEGVISYIKNEFTKIDCPNLPTNITEMAEERAIEIINHINPLNSIPEGIEEAPDETDAIPGAPEVVVAALEETDESPAEAAAKEKQFSICKHIVVYGCIIAIVGSLIGSFCAPK
jgi:hypothetical protein